MRTTIGNTKSPHPIPLPAYRASGLTLAAVLLLGAGCASTRPETAREVAATQPSNVAVSNAAFEKLWRAADLASRDLLFVPAREDRRAGIYKTEPMTSGQWFEPWRQDAITPAARTQSSLATIRRTITVTFEKTADGAYAARPSVLVERYSLAERRLTNSAGYRSVYRDRFNNFGTIETDAGLNLPGSYWYEIGNDPVLEARFAHDIEHQLKKL